MGRRRFHQKCSCFAYNNPKWNCCIRRIHRSCCEAARALDELFCGGCIR